jgi:DNA-binding SARP family transcriptional activator
MAKPSKRLARRVARIAMGVPVGLAIANGEPPPENGDLACEERPAMVGGSDAAAGAVGARCGAGTAENHSEPARQPVGRAAENARGVSGRAEGFTEANKPADIAAAVRALASTVESLRQQLVAREESIESKVDLLAAITLGTVNRVEGGGTVPRGQWLGHTWDESSTRWSYTAPRSPEGGARHGWPTTVVAFCLQPFELFVNYVPVRSWQGSRCQEILRLLLTRYPSPVARDVLIETFWSNADPVAARRSLHQAVYRLRETLRAVAGGEGLVYFHQGLYRFHPEAEVWTDAGEFERLATKANRSQAAGEIGDAIDNLATAETLYQDDYMHEFLYDDWCRDRRDFLRRVYVDVVTRLADHYSAQGSHGAAIALCRRLVARDPTDEAAYRRLMRSYLSEGNHHLAATTFRHCQEVLRRELGVEPSRETALLFEQIGTRRADHHDGPRTVSAR